VLSHQVDAVFCRWCGHGRSVVELAESESGGSGVDGPGEQEHQEPGAASRVT
jgi:hypothetical protein